MNIYSDLKSKQEDRELDRGAYLKRFSASSSHQIDFYSSINSPIYRTPSKLQNNTTKC